MTGVRLVGEMQDANGQVFSRVVWQDGRLGGEQGAEGGAWVAFLSLGLGDAGHHGGFGSIGDHAQGVAEPAHGFGQRIEALRFIQTSGGDMFGD